LWYGSDMTKSFAGKEQVTQQDVVARPLNLMAE